MVTAVKGDVEDGHARGRCNLGIDVLGDLLAVPRIASTVMDQVYDVDGDEWAARAFAILGETGRCGGMNIDTSNKVRGAFQSVRACKLLHSKWDIRHYYYHYYHYYQRLLR